MSLELLVTLVVNVYGSCYENVCDTYSTETLEHVQEFYKDAGINIVYEDKGNIERSHEFSVPLNNKLLKELKQDIVEDGEVTVLKMGFSTMNLSEYGAVGMGLKSHSLAITHTTLDKAIEIEKQVLAHEIAHVLGLNHVGEHTENLMVPFASDEYWELKDSQNKTMQNTIIRKYSK